MHTQQMRKEVHAGYAREYMRYARFAKQHGRNKEVSALVANARAANHESIRASKRTHCHTCLHVVIEPGDDYCMHCGTKVFR